MYMWVFFHIHSVQAPAALFHTHPSLISRQTQNITDPSVFSTVRTSDNLNFLGSSLSFPLSLRPKHLSKAPPALRSPITLAVASCSRSDPHSGSLWGPATSILCSSSKMSGLALPPCSSLSLWPPESPGFA